MVGRWVLSLLGQKASFLVFSLTVSLRDGRKINFWESQKKRAWLHLPKFWTPFSSSNVFCCLEDFRITSFEKRQIDPPLNLGRCKKNTDRSTLTLSMSVMSWTIGEIPLQMAQDLKVASVGLVKYFCSKWDDYLEDQCHLGYVVS